jgi:hypothetical protein
VRPEAHNPKVAGSNPAPAMSLSTTREPSFGRAFFFSKAVGGFGDGGRDLDPPFGLVVEDLQLERLEDLALDLGRCLAECLVRSGTRASSRASHVPAGCWVQLAASEIYCARSAAPRAPGQQGRYKRPWCNDYAVSTDLRRPHPVKPLPAGC